jgi:superfamily II DNA helicase RecQ
MQTLAVTATATAAVIADIRQSLRMQPSDQVFQETFDRPNLSYAVHLKTTLLEDLKDVAARAMDATSHEPAIIYVNTRAVANIIVPTLERMGVVRVYVGYPLGSVGLKSAVGLYPTRLQHV